MKRATIIWLGIVLWIALCVLCLFCHAGKIETALTERTTAALQTAGLTGIEVIFDGRNAIISGTVASEAIKNAAVTLIQSLAGVRSVANQVALAPVEAAPITEETAPVAETTVAKPEVNFPELLGKLTVNFETNQTELNQAAQGVLNQLETVLTDHPGLRLKIVGHADSRGSSLANQKLSEQRAQAVKTYLVNHGISATRLSVTGFGESKPVAATQTEADMARNRRVEFIQIKEN